MARPSRGGGVSSVPGSGQTNRVTLANAVVSGNHALGVSGFGPGGDAFGGGIYKGAGSTLSMQTSAISSNTATGGTGGIGGLGKKYAGGNAYGGGICNAGTLNVSTSTISADAPEGGQGGESGPCPHGSPGGPGGRSVGGGVDSVGALSVTRSTLSGSSSTGGSGGVGTGGITCSAPGGPGGPGIGGGLAEQGQVANSTVDANVAGGAPVGRGARGAALKGPVAGSAEASGSWAQSRW